MVPEEEITEDSVTAKLTGWNWFMRYVTRQLFNQKVILTVFGGFVSIAVAWIGLQQMESNKDTKDIKLSADTAKQKQAVAQVWDSTARKRNELWKAGVDSSLKQIIILLKK